VIGSYVRNRMFGLPPFPEEMTTGQTSEDALPAISRIHPKHKNKVTRKDKPV
jgi:hypothetical protein